ncbi:MAG: STAS domain-containing protein [Blastocatellia bacterium]|nr:STAS domain-containing protein [Blastocatellia bacterium]MBN8722523.1 STAS domain-containing protein [Acidobacteriota bacterium]
MIKVTEQLAGSIVMLNVNGKLSGGENYNLLSSKVVDLLGQGYILFILNLAEVTNADSTGIGELIVCLKRVKERGGEIKLAAPTQKVSSLIHMTNLDRIFEIHPSERSALNSFGH